MDKATGYILQTQVKLGKKLREESKAKMADTWKALKQKQKARITEIMFQIVCEEYVATGNMPEEDRYEKLARKAYSRCNVGKLAFKDMLNVFVKKQKRFAERIEEHGIPEEKSAKVKKTEKEKLAIKRKARANRKLKKQKAELDNLLDQDDDFCCIVGYTSGGAPYGLQWWEVGINPQLPFEEKVRLYREGEYGL